MSNTSVYVSYNWEREGDDPVVAKLEYACKVRGIDLQRDIRKVGYGQSIKKFMDLLGAGDHIVVVLSDSYLKSPNCIYELRAIHRMGSFSERISPVVLKGTKIYDPLSRNSYRKYWYEQWEQLDADIRSRPLPGADSLIRDQNQYAEFHSGIDEWLTVLADMNTLSHDIHVDTDFAALLDRIQSRQVSEARDYDDKSEARLRACEPRKTAPLLPFDAYVAYIDRKTESIVLETALSNARKTAGPITLATLAYGRRDDWLQGLAVRFQWHSAADVIEPTRMPIVEWPARNATGSDDRFNAVTASLLAQLRRIDGRSVVGETSPPSAFVKEILRERSRLVVHYQIASSFWMTGDHEVVGRCIGWWHEFDGLKPRSEIVLLFSIIEAELNGWRATFGRLLGKESNICDAFARHLSNVTPLSETGAVPPVVAGDLREWPENLARGLNAPRATAAKLRTAAGRHLGEGSALPVGKLKDHLFQDAEVIAVFAPDESSSRNKTVTLST